MIILNSQISRASLPRFRHTITPLGLVAIRDCSPAGFRKTEFDSCRSYTRDFESAEVRVDGVFAHGWVTDS